jgi:hypothetical protein
MKLSELIDKAQKAKEKHGDMGVFALVSYDEDCDKCGQSELHNKSGLAYTTEVCIDSDGKYFFIDAEEE